ncbi:MAG: hypothetical protein LBC40_08710 [Dysgonamonadaceae bacterium]|jgi:hypothetical protein|nr:hypothetical protein [Dysgonamonadaceae bacterium]
MAKTIPTKDVDFNAKQDLITSKTAQNAEKWKINTSWFNNKVVPARSAWTSAWQAYQNPSTRTEVITGSKNRARKNYEPLLGQLVEVLKSSPDVTPEELDTMGIAWNKGGGGIHNPVPKTYPDFYLDSSTIRFLLVFFRDQGATSRAKPHGVHGAEIRWGILDKAPTDVKELLNSSFDTRSPFTLEFNESDRGKTVWFCLRWENTTGEKGPWSEIVSAIIP